MFKPMLACNVTDLTKIKFPVYCSPKIDGIRCVILDGKVLSRSLKPIPNKYIQEQLSSLPNLDGELYIHGKSFNDISSEVMSEEGEPHFELIVFDVILDKPFNERLSILSELDSSDHHKVLVYTEVNSVEHLLSLEEACLEFGHEGLMIRAPQGPYKYGRSTEKEGYLMKLKRFEDSEAIIVDFAPEYENTNVQIVNELGHKKRSSHKENKVAKEMCGALIVQDVKTGIESRVSAGLDHDLKKDIWINKALYKGRLIKYKYMSSLKEKPRHPTFLGFRDLKDL